MVVIRTFPTVSPLNIGGIFVPSTTRKTRSLAKERVFFAALAMFERETALDPTIRQSLMNRKMKRRYAPGWTM